MKCVELLGQRMPTLPNPVWVGLAASPTGLPADNTSTSIYFIPVLILLCTDARRPPCQHHFLFAPVQAGRNASVSIGLLPRIVLAATNLLCLNIRLAHLAGESI
jgi:hypothetical protein